MNWNWSFRLLRLFATDVRIHWTLPLFFLYFVMRGAERGSGLALLGLSVLLPFVLLFASVMLHEFGHVFAARHFGLPVHHIILTPIGGLAVLGESSPSPRSEFVIAVAGPAVNLLLAGLAAAAFGASGGTLTWELLFPLSSRGFAPLWLSGQLGLLVLYDFIQMQMVLFFFNVLLVAYPMDGGRILLSVLWWRRGYRRGLALSCTIAKVMAVVLAGVGLLLLAPLLVVMAVFLYLQVTTTQRQLPYLIEPEGHDRRARQQRLGQDGWLARWKHRRTERAITRVLRKAEKEGLHALSAREREVLRQRRQRMN